MAETSTIFGFMKYVSATDILSDFKKTVDSHFVNSLLLLNKYPNLRVVLITDKKGAYYKDKDMMIYQKELASNFDKDLFLVKYMASELKGNSEMTSLYRGVNQ